MTNVEIIAKAAATAGIAEPINTYAHWRELGFQVKKGSKALIKIPIWKHVSKANKETGENEEKMFMKTAAFFGLSQVEPIA